jgi:hypothetical protein
VKLTGNLAHGWFKFDHANQVYGGFGGCDDPGKLVFDRSQKGQIKQTTVVQTLFFRSGSNYPCGGPGPAAIIAAVCKITDVLAPAFTYLPMRSYLFRHEFTARFRLRSSSYDPTRRSSRKDRRVPPRRDSFAVDPPNRTADRKDGKGKAFSFARQSNHLRGYLDHNSKFKPGKVADFCFPPSQRKAKK